MSAATHTEALESYRIPKDEVPVEVAFRSADPEEFSVFLSPRAAYHPGRERPSDLLFNDDPFLTLKSSDGSVRFVNKSAIAWMSVARNLEQSGRCEIEDAHAASRFRPIDIELVDGHANASLCGRNRRPFWGDRHSTR